jgi:hypothetical protein
MTRLLVWTIFELDRWLEPFFDLKPVIAEPLSVTIVVLAKSSLYLSSSYPPPAIEAPPKESRETSSAMPLRAVSWWRPPSKARENERVSRNTSRQMAPALQQPDGGLRELTMSRDATGSSSIAGGLLMLLLEALNDIIDAAGVILIELRVLSVDFGTAKVLDYSAGGVLQTQTAELSVHLHLIVIRLRWPRCQELRERPGRHGDCCCCCCCCCCQQ